MWHDVGVAVCLMLVLEGILPFIQPARWRNLVALLAETSDRSLRIMGFTSMLIGVILLYALNTN